MKKFNDARDWFLEKRFGLFIHWGLYSVGGICEWERERHVHGTPKEKYDEYITKFRAEKFNPAAWIDFAQGAGMEYIVFTTKHHDGFCLWDSKETDYNIMHTPFGRDALRELADECHKRDFPLVLYHSCLDWQHPAYPNDGNNSTVFTDSANHNMPEYINYLKRQIRELCTEYGKISGIWWDMNTNGWSDRSINAMIRELQPGCVINNRGFSDDGDFNTPERAPLDSDAAFNTPTEACDSVTPRAWSCRLDPDYSSVYYFEKAIAGYIAHGANYLLNIGPYADGTLPEEAKRIVTSVGKWYQKVREALIAPHCRWLVYRKDIICTGSGKKLYFILLNPPDSSMISFIPINTPGISARLLNTGRPLDVALYAVGGKHKEQVLHIRRYPQDELYGEVPVIEVEFAEDVSEVVNRAAWHHYAW